MATNVAKSLSKESICPVNKICKLRKHKNRTTAQIKRNKFRLVIEQKPTFAVETQRGFERAKRTSSSILFSLQAEKGTSLRKEKEIPLLLEIQESAQNGRFVKFYFSDNDETQTNGLDNTKTQKIKVRIGEKNTIPIGFLFFVDNLIDRENLEKQASFLHTARLSIYDLSKNDERKLLDTVDLDGKVIFFYDSLRLGRNVYSDGNCKSSSNDVVFKTNELGAAVSVVCENTGKTVLLLEQPRVECNSSDIFIQFPDRLELNPGEKKNIFGEIKRTPAISGESKCELKYKSADNWIGTGQFKIMFDNLNLYLEKPNYTGKYGQDINSLELIKTGEYALRGFVPGYKNVDKYSKDTKDSFTLSRKKKVPNCVQISLQTRDKRDTNFFIKENGEKKLNQGAFTFSQYKDRLEVCFYSKEEKENLDYAATLEITAEYKKGEGNKETEKIKLYLQGNSIFNKSKYDRNSIALYDFSLDEFNGKFCGPSTEFYFPPEWSYYELVEKNRPGQVIYQQFEKPLLYRNEPKEALLEDKIFYGVGVGRKVNPSLLLDKRFCVLDNSRISSLYYIEQPEKFIFYYPQKQPSGQITTEYQEVSLRVRYGRPSRNIEFKMESNLMIDLLDSRFSLGSRFSLLKNFLSIGKKEEGQNRMSLGVEFWLGTSRYNSLFSDLSVLWAPKVMVGGILRIGGGLTQSKNIRLYGIFGGGYSYTARPAGLERNEGYGFIGLETKIRPIPRIQGLFLTAASRYTIFSNSSLANLDTSVGIELVF